MKGVDDVYEWRNALDELKDPKVRKGHMDSVFQILRFSYIRLNDSSLQQCLLFYALFPEDFDMKREELIKHLIVEGTIERRKCRREENDKGQVMLSKLVNLCLLEHGRGDSYVKMHDLIRDMILQILMEESSVMVEASEQLRECPDVEERKQNLLRVSLMSNNIREIGSGHSPMCPNLSTILLSYNQKLGKISNSFFERFDGLKVFDLSFTPIEVLPHSISNLVSLVALLLKSCKALRHVPSVAKLVALEMLDLRECRIEQVAHGLALLHNLRYLDMDGCLYLREFPAGVLPNLCRLRFLRICGHFKVKGVEVGCLKNLEHSVCGFSNLVELNNYLRSQIDAKPLHAFKIYVSDRIYAKSLYKKYVNLSDCGLIREEIFMHFQKELKASKSIQAN